MVLSTKKSNHTEYICVMRFKVIFFLNLLCPNFIDRNITIKLRLFVPLFRWEHPQCPHYDFNNSLSLSLSRSHTHSLQLSPLFFFNLIISLSFFTIPSLYYTRILAKLGTCSTARFSVSTSTTPLRLPFLAPGEYQTLMENLIRTFIFVILSYFLSSRTDDPILELLTQRELVCRHQLDDHCCRHCWVGCSNPVDLNTTATPSDPRCLATTAKIKQDMNIFFRFHHKFHVQF